MWISVGYILGDPGRGTGQNNVWSLVTEHQKKGHHAQKPAGTLGNKNLSLGLGHGRMTRKQL